MALPSSGAITMGQIRTELKKTGAISLGSDECRKLAGVSSGAIKMSDFYGKSNGQDIIIKSGYKSANIGTKEYYEVWGFSVNIWVIGSASPSYVKINSKTINILRLVYVRDVRDNTYSSELIINMPYSDAPSSITIEINNVKYTSTSKGSFFTNYTRYYFSVNVFSIFQNQTNHTIKFLIQ